AMSVKKGKEAVRDKRSQGRSEEATVQRKQDAIGEQLPADPSARSAQGQACADLTPASRSVRQEEAGDVQAGQSQQHSSGCEQDPERLRQPATQPGMALRSRSEFEARGQ